MTRTHTARAIRNGYEQHTGFGGVLGQNRSDGRHAFANAATLIESSYPTAAEAVVAAGLDWSVSKRPLWTPSNSGKLIEITDRHSIVRDDTDQVLSTVGKSYHAIDNVDAFDWADFVPGKYVAGGALHNNRQVYLIKELDTSIEAGGDEHSMFLFLRSSHDGTTSLQAMATPVRIRCMNMLPIAIRKAKFRFAVRHVESYADRLQQAARINGLVTTYATEFTATAKRLSETELLLSEVEKILAEAMPGRVELQKGVIENLQNSTTISTPDRKNAWGLLNAASEFFEWKRDVSSPMHALQANVDGQGARFRNAVAQRLLVVGRR